MLLFRWYARRLYPLRIHLDIVPRLAILTSHIIVPLNLRNQQFAFSGKTDCKAGPRYPYSPPLGLVALGRDAWYGNHDGIVIAPAVWPLTPGGLGHFFGTTRAWSRFGPCGGPGADMIPYDRSFKDIIQDFRSMGIDTSMPGFYDDPAFLEAERQTPTALRNYARFVCDRAYDENYLRMAAEKVRIVADALHKELEKDGRKGACIDVSQVASRMLENEGVWNCLLTGALTIYYPPEVSRQPRFFWPLDVTEAVAAHAWLCAPPFRVVDITIREQPHELGLRDPLPRLVLAENLKPASVQDRDIVSPKAKAVGQRRGYTTAELIRQEKPDIKDFFRVFPPGIAEHEGVRIKYIPWQVSAAEAPLENITALSLNGKYGQEIYETIVTPRLSGMLP